MTVGIRDTVVLPRGSHDEWLERFRAEYLPGAEKRGMRLEDVRSTPVGVSSAGLLVAVTLDWMVSDASALWGLRESSAVPEVTEWWDYTAQVAEHRERKFLTKELEPQALPERLYHRWLVAVYGVENVSASALRAMARAASGLHGTKEVPISAMGLHVEPSRAMGCATWDLTTWRQPEEVPVVQDLLEKHNEVVARVEAVRLAPVRWRIDPLTQPSVKRTLMLGHDPSGPVSAEELERRLAEAADLLPVRGWSVSRTVGAGRWTHAWELEFDKVDGFRSGYRGSAVVAGLVTPLLDPESPQCAVRVDSDAVYEVGVPVLHAPLAL